MRSLLPPTSTQWQFKFLQGRKADPEGSLEPIVWPAPGEPQKVAIRRGICVDLHAEQMAIRQLMKEFKQRFEMERNDEYYEYGMSPLHGLNLNISEHSTRDWSWSRVSHRSFVPMGAKGLPQLASILMVITRGALSPTAT